MVARQDRRVQRTRQLIRAAFRALLKEKGYEALTVQDIIDRANIGRATFYAHFENKDELFTSGFDELRAPLKARQHDAHAAVTSPSACLLSALTCSSMQTSTVRCSTR